MRANFVKSIPTDQDWAVIVLDDLTDSEIAHIDKLNDREHCLIIGNIDRRTRSVLDKLKDRKVLVVTSNAHDLSIASVVLTENTSPNPTCKYGSIRAKNDPCTVQRTPL